MDILPGNSKHLGVKTTRIWNQGLEEFKEPEVNEYGPMDSSLKPTIGCDKELTKIGKKRFSILANALMTVDKIEKPVRKNNDAPIIKDWVSDDEEQDGSKTKPEKKTVIPTAAKIEKLVRKPVKYAEMYRVNKDLGVKQGIGMVKNPIS
ncbi:hypothetical protein Tco_0097341 [Tanacetum coccineum]